MSITKLIRYDNFQSIFNSSGVEIYIVSFLFNFLLYVGILEKLFQRDGLFIQQNLDEGCHLLQFEVNESGKIEYFY